MEVLSFKKSIADDLLYLLWEKNILILIIAIWVDDMVISSSGLAAIITLRFSLVIISRSLISKSSDTF